MPNAPTVYKVILKIDSKAGNPPCRMRNSPNPIQEWKIGVVSENIKPNKRVLNFDTVLSYYLAVQNLYLTARHVKAKTSKWARLTPRTVRDCIPNSKLAQYSNYEYDDARELSYSPMVIKFERLYETFDREDVREPWMLEEIDDLFIGFLSYSSPAEEKPCTESHETLPCPKDFCELSYESPFLDARNFDEMALKLKIVSRNLKKIWDTKYFPYYGWHPVAKAKHLILFKSPACQMFSSVKEEIEESDWLKNMSETQGNLSQMKALTKGFKEQNTWIFKKQSSRSWLESHHDSMDLSPHRRLYSAVLQGSSPNQLPSDTSNMASFQFPSVKSQDLTKNSETATDTNCYSSYNRQPNLSSTLEQPVPVNRRMVDVNALGFHCGGNPQQSYPYYTSRTNVQTTSSTSTPIASVFATPTNYANYQYFPPTNTFLSPRMYSNNFIPNTSVLNFRQTNYFPLVLQNAAAPYAQSSFFNYQRGTFPSYRTMVFPQRPQVVVPSSGWFLQPPVKINPPTINMLATRPPIHAPSYHYRSPNAGRPRLAKPSTGSIGSPSLPASKDDSINQDLENIVAKTVSAVLDDSDPFVPVTGVPSDELELQALEQYSPSNTNVFQDLERQAAEQYETSENWKSPPGCHKPVTFGGCLNVKLVRFRCVEEILGLGCSNTIKAEVPNLVLGSDSRN